MIFFFSPFAVVVTLRLLVVLCLQFWLIIMTTHTHTICLSDYPAALSLGRADVDPGALG